MTRQTSEIPEEQPPQMEEDGAQHARLDIKRLLPSRRIDKYIRHRFPDFSRTLIQRLIAEKAVTVNDQPTKSSYQLQPGDRIDLILPPLPTSTITPEPIPLDIIYEDEYFLAVNKQSDLIVHPARGNPGGTLVNALVHYSDTLSSINGDFRPGIVHRLDRYTTGVMVVAKTDTAHWRLAHQFEHRYAHKEYLAVVHGTLDLDADVIDIPLGRHPHIREKYAARPESGKSAITQYHLEKQYRGYALLRCFPKTGRTHQIRVHLSLIKHPIVADTIYGGKTMSLTQLANNAQLPQSPDADLDPELPVITRQALHAHRLHLQHPISKKPVTLEAPIPQDLKLLLDLLKKYRLP